MAAKNWMKELQKLEGAVVGDFDPHSRVIKTASPSFNFTFGKGWGLPQGFTLSLWGPAKGGKSLIAHAMAGQLHLDDPEAIVLKYDTEMRTRGQLTPDQRVLWGIDNSRFMAYETNNPEFVFNAIARDVAKQCEEGAPIKMIIIDSVNGVQGRRALDNNDITVQQRGDTALTIGEGLKMVLAVQRKYNIGLVLNWQERAEQDQHQIMRHKTKKMAAPYAARHYAEYFMYVEHNETKDGRQDMLGNKFTDESTLDMKSEAEVTAHKVRVKMEDSSMGPKGRVGEFTLDYDHGIVNVHEEVFLLGVNRGIIDHPTTTSYEFGGKKWHGKPAMLEALKTSKELQQSILSELQKRDREGRLTSIEEETIPALDEDE